MKTKLSLVAAALFSISAALTPIANASTPTVTDRCISVDQFNWSGRAQNTFNVHFMKDTDQGCANKKPQVKAAAECIYKNTEDNETKGTKKILWVRASKYILAPGWSSVTCPLSYPNSDDYKFSYTHQVGYHYLLQNGESGFYALEIIYQ